MVNTKLVILQFLTLVLSALVLGVFWGTWFTLTRSIDSFSAAEFIHIGNVIIANVAVPMSMLMPSAIIIMFLSIWMYRDRKSAAFYSAIFSLVLLLVTLLITLLVLVPIDNNIKQWTSESLPENWNLIRDRWDRFHFARTVTSFLSFASYALSVLLHRHRI
jgi:hypothetical protein